MSSRFAALASVALIALAACSSDTTPPTDDFDWDAFFANDRDTDETPVDASPRDTSRPQRDTGEPDTSLPPGQDGESCESADDCIGAACLADPVWPAGYCTSSGCRDEDDCSGASSACVVLDGPPLCLGLCESDDDCRERYACTDPNGDGVTVCLPDFSDFQLDGEPCTSDDECVGGTCFLDPEWPQGHCTNLACESNRDCITGDAEGRCLINGDRRYCVLTCESADTCRPDYGCRAIDRNTGFCAPDVADPVDVGDGDTTYPFDIFCAAPIGGVLQFDYEIAAETTSYLVVPWATDGRNLSPDRITLPSGGVIDLLGENAFQNVTSQLLGFTNPVLVPATPAHVAQLEAGTHTMAIATQSSEVCWYVIEETSSGTTLDLHLYLAGVPGVTADTAEAYAPLTDVFDAIAELLAPTGIVIGERRWYDVPESLAALHSVVRSQWNIDELVRSSRLVGPELDDALVLNVFLTRGFSWDGIIGLSAGLPGAAGLHGTRSSGVVMTSEYADGSAAGSAFTAIVLAHEMGHYLGLFHTTEFTFAHWDPLDDTPRCTTGNPSTCPDLTNLMFPLAGDDHTVITPGQTSVLLANPLTRD